MKALIVFILVWGAAGVYANGNCSQYFVYSKEELLQGIPSELEELVQSWRESREFDPVEFYQKRVRLHLEMSADVGIFQNKVDYLQSLILQQEAQRQGDLKKERALEARKFQLQRRVQEFGSIAYRLYLRLIPSVKNEEHRVALKKLSEELGQVRRDLSQQRRVSERHYKDALGEALREKMQRSQLDLERSIQDIHLFAREDVRLIKFQKDLQASQALEGARVVIREYVENFVHLHWGVLEKVEAYREALEERVCRATSCQTLGEILLEDLRMATQELRGARDQQASAVRLNLGVSLGIQIREVLRERLKNPAYVTEQIRERDLESLEYSVLTLIDEAVSRRESAFSTLLRIEQGLSQLLLDLRGAFHPFKELQGEWSELDLSTQRVGQDVEFFQIGVMDFFKKVNGLKEAPTISSKNYRDLSERAQRLSRELQSLLYEAEIGRHELEKTLDIDGAFQEEVQSLEKLLSQELFKE